MSKVTELARDSAHPVTSQHGHGRLDRGRRDARRGDRHLATTATVLHPQRFPDMAATLTRLFASAATELASIKSRRKL